MEIEVKVSLIGNDFRDCLYKSEFSLSIKGMKMANREALRTLPEKIEQSFIDCIELECGKKYAELARTAFSQQKCQGNEEKSQL